MASLAALKKNSASFDVSRLNKEIEKMNTSGEFAEDTRFWQPEMDKAGNGQAIFRFLPAPPVDGDEALPWVRVFSHGFKGPTGRWYVENSLTTIGQKDPVTEFNSVLWNKSNDDNSPSRKQARAQKRKLGYVSNILVISDPMNPKNEGKVFLYRYGKKVFEKITAKMNPEFEGDKPVNPFDLWSGSNFKLRIKTVDKTESNPKGYRNYDNSSFDDSIGTITMNGAALTDEQLEVIYNSEFSLKEFIDATNPKQFKPYDVLKKQLHAALGISETSSASSSIEDFATGSVSSKKSAAQKAITADEDDEDLAKIKALIDGDEEEAPF